MSNAAEKITPLPITTLQVVDPNESAMVAQAKSFVEAANQIVISDQPTFEAAAKYLSENKSEQKRLDAERREIVDPLNDVVKKVNAKFKPATEALVTAEGIVKRKIGAYQMEQERIRREEQARAEERARKERERLEARAEKAAESGSIEKAAELQDRASTTVAVAPVAETGKVSGISTRMAWVGEVTNIVELCKAIGNGDLPPTLIDVKRSELNRVAATWQNTREFPGLRISQKPVVASL